MEIVNYSKNWDSVFNMPEEELYQIDPKTLDEEDLDALSIRLSKLSQEDKMLSVYQEMLLTDKENPAVEYTNIYEKVIIHLMGEKDYIRASLFLKDYLLFDEQKRNGYRSNFIRRNLGVCYIFSGKVDKGEKVRTALINDVPDDVFPYNELAIEFYYAGDKDSMLKYLSIGMDKAKSYGKDFWFKYFSDQINEVEK
jgi:tetratricopeptide (TPR) repeat protein